uniref:Uncharacterized protein n=1 Tax=Lepeophtheirus salmonis TaxID=72036 RepID=A0A0K2V1W1_LEPSM
MWYFHFEITVQLISRTLIPSWTKQYMSELSSSSKRLLSSVYKLFFLESWNCRDQ